MRSLYPSLVAAFWLALFASTATGSVQQAQVTFAADPTPPISSKSELSSQYTPEEAYERALYLFRSSTLSHQQQKLAALHAADGSGTRSGKASAHASGPLALWNNFLSSSYSPFGALLRLWTKLFEIINSGFQVVRHSHSFVARIFAILQGIGGGGRGLATARGGFWNSAGSNSLSDVYKPEQAYVTTGVDSQNDGKWLGAQSRQLWPNWEAFSNEALFGPFIDDGSSRRQRLSYTDRLLLKVKHSVLGKKNARAGSPASNSAQARRLRKVAEAVDLLEWVAWPDAGANSPASIISGALARATSPSQADEISAAMSDVQSDALWVLAEHSLWGTHGVEADPKRAHRAFEQLAHVTGNASAHARLAFLESSRWKQRDNLLGRENPHQQAKALLHYEAAALGGSSDGQIALGYRYHAGIGTPPSCANALQWYEAAADQGTQRRPMLISMNMC